MFFYSSVRKVDTECEKEYFLFVSIISIIYYKKFFFFPNSIYSNIQLE